MRDACDAAVEAFLNWSDGDIKAAIQSALKAFSAATWRPAKDVAKEPTKIYLAACVDRLGDFSGYYVVRYSPSSKAWIVSNGRAHMPLEARPVRLVELTAGFALPGSEVTALSIGI